MNKTTPPEYPDAYFAGTNEGEVLVLHDVVYSNKEEILELTVFLAKAFIYLADKSEGEYEKK